jgi:general nucleoside transport system permease protein
VIAFERRLDSPTWMVVAVPFASLLVALVLAGILLGATGHNPFSTYRQIVQASFTEPGALGQTLISATPLLFTGLAVAVAFRMKVWNIGGEGQLYMGALGASGIGLALSGLPAPVVVVAMMLGGLLAGALWAAVPGALRAYMNTNEILTSLMLNYVAGLLLYYLIYDSKSYWRDLVSPAAKVFPQGKFLPDSGTWPAFSLGSLDVPLGLLLGIGVGVILWWMIRATRYGYEMRVISDSPNTARYAGMHTRRKILSVMTLSGALAGLGGASQIGDFNHVLDPKGLQAAGFGYTGIVVAALARYNPLAVVVVSFLIGALTNAGFALQGPGFPIGLVGTIEGILLFCVLGGEILARYRIHVTRRPAAKRAPPEPPPGAPEPITVGEVTTG